MCFFFLRLVGHHERFLLVSALSQYSVVVLFGTSHPFVCIIRVRLLLTSYAVKALPEIAQICPVFAQVWALAIAQAKKTCLPKFAQALEHVLPKFAQNTGKLPKLFYHGILPELLAQIWPSLPKCPCLGKFAQAVNNSEVLREDVVMCL